MKLKRSKSKGDVKVTQDGITQQCWHVPHHCRLVTPIKNLISSSAYFSQDSMWTNFVNLCRSCIDPERSLGPTPAGESGGGGGNTVAGVDEHSSEGYTTPRSLETPGTNATKHFFKNWRLSKVHQNIRATYFQELVKSSWPVLTPPIRFKMAWLNNRSNISVTRSILLHFHGMRDSKKISFDGLAKQDCVRYKERYNANVFVYKDVQRHLVNPAFKFRLNYRRQASIDCSKNVL